MRVTVLALTALPPHAHDQRRLALGHALQCVQHTIGRGRLHFDVRGQQGIGRGDRSAFVANAGYTLAW